MSFKQWLTGEKVLALAMGVAGALVIALGIHRFWIRAEPFGVAAFLGCVVGAFGAFFLLLTTDYLLHHARLVFIPWVILLTYFAFVQPHFAVGLGTALWFMFVSQLRN